MNAVLLVHRLARLGAHLRVDEGHLVVDAPVGVLTHDVKEELTRRKAEVLAVVGGRRSLAEYAADRLPVIRLTIRETGDTARDFDLVARVRRAVEEFQPGGNHVFVTIVTPDGRRVVVEWRAIADRELRMAVARLLAGRVVCRLPGPP